MVLSKELEILFCQVDTDIYDRFKKFRQKKLDEGDPLVRYCTTPRCEGRMRADHMNARKVTCPECSQQICFRCRDDWHGYFTSCERNLESKYEVWHSNSGIKILFCPMCRTKIERITGCNHMTCGFCEYEFCWICRGFAGHGSDHYNPLNPSSCGAGMMDENPGGLI